MTALERLQQIQKECIDRKDCSDCPHMVEVSFTRSECIYGMTFGTEPFNWNLENIEGVLKEY